MWLLIVILLIALAAGMTGLLVKGLFWLFVLSTCVVLAGLILAGIWHRMRPRPDRRPRSTS